MKTRTLSGASLLLYTTIVAGLLFFATACDSTPIEPVKPKVSKVLPKDIYAEDPPEKPKRPGDDD